MVGAGGAILAARTQSRGQHARWRREARREVYAEFLSRAEAVKEAVSTYKTALDLDGRLADAEPPDAEAVLTARDACARACSAPLLEGPAEVRRAALELRDALTAVAHRWVGSGQPDRTDRVLGLLGLSRGDAFPDGEPPRDFWDQLDWLNWLDGLVRRFLVAATRALELR